MEKIKTTIIVIITLAVGKINCNSIKHVRVNLLSDFFLKRIPDLYPVLATCVHIKKKKTFSSNPISLQFHKSGS